MKNEVRLFVAVDLPTPVIQEVTRIQTILKKSKIFEGRFVKPDQAHITLSFIGLVPDQLIPNIDLMLQKVDVSSCLAHLSNINIFTKGDVAAVIYLEVIASCLKKLSDAINTALEPWILVDKNQFVSHITLSRVKTVENEDAFFDYIRGITVEPINFEIDSFALKKSITNANGPEYFTITEYALK